ncbi:DUF177 domain-containing protein [Geobacter sp. SVR]|uniref:YceD family protein n=1 Tax=Geobacter sp. SVR TaxID=2495594 RepID=UPI00143EFD61|nr:DUF177 domain-containing protein [Geobacter sp. SVR]BCS53929.1 hypothetical protein GSVR_22370 [Geobacter sp. SVR]GCF86290.1 hypothetical protein GSbR_28900 [Geobacter sp. SVR]
MKIVVDHIKEKPLVLKNEDDIQAFPVLDRLQSDGDCTFTGPVRSDITVSREYDHIRIAGRVSAPIRLTCSRCLEAYDSAVDSNFSIFFRKGTPEEVPVEDEVELNEQDLISGTYSGDEIDLTHEIEEQVAMEIPLKPLCSENCKGLCSTCGTDLNRGSCTCSREQINFKFSALKDFKVSR